MNAIDDDLPVALAAAVAEADADPDVHVMVLAGNGSAFCAGYDLAYYAENQGGNAVVQDMLVGACSRGFATPVQTPNPRQDGARTNRIRCSRRPCPRNRC